MAPRVARRTVDEIDREFDELASVLSDPREQLITSGIYRIHTFGSIKYFLCIKNLMYCSMLHKRKLGK